MSLVKVRPLLPSFWPDFRLCHYQLGRPEMNSRFYLAATAFLCISSGIARIGFAQSFSFSNGSFGSTAPSIGGYDPNSAAHLGFRAGGFSFGLEMGKGSTRSNFVEAPSITVPNGLGGSMFSGTLRPFATGFVPVVGGNVVDNSLPLNGVTLAVSSGQLDTSNLGDPEKSRALVSQPIELKSLSSTANQASESVAAIKERKAQERAAVQQAIEAALNQVEDLLAEDNYTKAKMLLRSTLRICKTDSQKALINQRLNALRDKKK